MAVNNDPQQTLQTAIARHQRGDLSGAIAAYETVLNLQPGNVSALANLASALKQAGQPEQALSRFRQALALDDNLPQLWFNFANLLQAQQQPAEAEQAYRRALTLNPELYQAHFNLGRLLQQQKRLSEADYHYRQTLRLQPDFAWAYSNLGNLLRSQGHVQAAIEHHRQALRLAPDNADYQLNLGNALLDAEQFQAAAESYRQALRRRPDHVDTLVNLGNALHAAGDTAAARTAYQQALALEPKSVLAALALARLLQAETQTAAAETLLRETLAYHPHEPRLLKMLAGLLYSSRQPEQALACYQQAIAAQPVDADSYNGLAVALHDLGRIEEALSAWHQALALDPQHVGAHTNLGTLYRKLKRHQEAVEQLRHAVRLAPTNPMARAGLAFTLLDVGHISEALAILHKLTREQPDFFEGQLSLGNALTLQARIREALAVYQRAQAIDPNNHAAISNFLFASLYSDQHDAKAITALHRELTARIASQARLRLPPKRRAGRDRPLRIGYLSPDLCSHPVAFFLEPILANHDPRRVAVTCYSLVTAPDATSTRLRELAPAWHDCYGWSDERLAGQIQADGIDILVDLAGHTAGNRMPLLTRRPAPIQALYLGYPCTSGATALDYLIGDRWVCPPEQAHLYTEQVLALERCFLCFRPSATAPPVAPAPVQSYGYVTFGCFNNLAKVSPSTVKLWARLLQTVPQSRLVLKALSFADAGTCELFRRRFEDLGIDRRRLDLLPPSTPLARYLAEYARVDIGLDPLPYNGGTTTCQALWMGVPVITLAGEHFYSRMGASILHNAGLPELVACSAEEYVAIADRLAADPQTLVQLRAGLRERLRSCVAV